MHQRYRGAGAEVKRSRGAGVQRCRGAEVQWCRCRCRGSKEEQEVQMCRSCRSALVVQRCTGAGGEARRCWSACSLCMQVCRGGVQRCRRWCRCAEVVDQKYRSEKVKGEEVQRCKGEMCRSRCICRCADVQMSRSACPECVQRYEDVQRWSGSAEV